MTVREALTEGTKKLRGHRCATSEAVREAEALLMRAARIRREQFFSSPEKILLPSAARNFFALIDRRTHHEPLDHILGSAWFRGREFKVNEATLIPRPATESVVEAAIAAGRAAHVTEAVDVG